MRVLPSDCSTLVSNSAALARGRLAFAPEASAARFSHGWRRRGVTAIRTRTSRSDADWSNARSSASLRRTGRAPRRSAATLVAWRARRADGGRHDRRACAILPRRRASGDRTGSDMLGWSSHSSAAWSCRPSAAAGW